jgi:hypothetical protein
MTKIQKIKKVIFNVSAANIFQEKKEKLGQNRLSLLVFPHPNTVILFSGKPMSVIVRPYYFKCSILYGMVNT